MKDRFFEAGTELAKQSKALLFGASEIPKSQRVVRQPMRTLDKSVDKCNEAMSKHLSKFEDFRDLEKKYGPYTFSGPFGNYFLEVLGDKYLRVSVMNHDNPSKADLIWELGTFERLLKVDAGDSTPNRFKGRGLGSFVSQSQREHFGASGDGWIDVEVDTRSFKLEIQLVRKPDELAVQKFQQLGQKLKRDSGGHATATSGVADELERLSTLRSSGALTEEEFLAAKARILGI